MAPPRLLVLRALGLGDLLTGIPALRALARAYPQHRRLLAVPRWLAPLVILARVADEVVEADFRSRLGTLPDIGPPDVAVNLHGRGPASHRALLALRPAALLGFPGPGVEAGAPAWREDEHEVERWCRLLGTFGIPADPSDLALDVPQEAAPPCACEATVIHPGAGTPAKRWPVGRWAAVAQAERRDGRRVVLTGSAAERPLALRVAQAAGLREDDVLAGRTTVLELAATVAVAARVVCSDTGTAHLATAVGTPSVVLFGPVPPAHWGPPRDRPQHRVLWRGESGDAFAPRPHRGLLRIGVGDVLAALEALPGGRAAEVE